MVNDTRSVNRVSRNPDIDFMASDIIQPRKAKNQARVDIKELPALLRDIDTSETRGITRIAIKLMAYTFVRTNGYCLLLSLKQNGRKCLDRKLHLQQFC